ncbi:H-NS family nucleoid-associated regulatory protein [Shimia haliotis]|uniref:DNA-binding protein H-NS n=1 Tax=Shimia haliotis TaxID=1280847 RepID=A0A1I4CPH6_9RHOB|nr:H-NS histone family protein [Shimia haliotis]SFK83152.1 DNA-binding protein H-NS [Shimia haliotis]
MNLTKMSYDELVSLKSEIDIEIKKREADRRRDALKAVEEAAEQFGYSLADLAAATGLGKRRGSLNKGVPKYADPEDKTRTWTGKGRKPKWFDEALAAGVTPEQMEL